MTPEKAPSRFRVKRVDGFRKGTGELLRTMHDIVFANTAPQIDPESGWWWVAYLDREPVAFASLNASATISNAGYLSRSGVLPSHRGHGLQTKLIRTRETFARRLKWTRMVTDTTDNPHSSNALIRSGYRLYVPTAPWAFDHSLYWTKDL